MAAVFYCDLLKRFVEIDHKIQEFFDMQQEADDQIKIIEDETNKNISEHDKQEAKESTDYMQSFTKALDAAYEYAKQLINKIYDSQLRLDPKVPNAALFQNQGKQNAAEEPLQYSWEYTENITLLERLDEEITSKIRICTRGEGSILGFGKKFAGLNDTLYREIYTMMYQAYNFFDGLYQHFDQIYNSETERLKNRHNNYFDEMCRQADARVDAIHQEYMKKIKAWVLELDQYLDSVLPVSYLEHLEAEYEKSKDKFYILTEEDGKENIPLGRLYYSVADLEVNGWEYVQEVFKNKYGKYVYNGFLWGYVFWNHNENRSLILTDYGEKGNKEAGREVLETLIFENIMSVPAGDFTFTLCSASGMIDEYGKLSHFISRFPQISGGKIITEKEKIRETLNQYVALMNEIIQNKLIDYESLEEFNIKNSNQKIPYRSLCITGFPAGFDDQMLEQVSILLNQGYKAGIQVVILYEDQYYQEGRNESWMRTIMSSDQQLIWRNFSWQNAMYNVIFLEFFKIPYGSLQYNLFDEFERQYEKETNKVLELTDLIKEENKFSSYSGEMLRIPIGINEKGEIQYLEMGDPVANGTSHYAIIAGPTGSGKSTLLHTIIMGALQSYTEKELQLYMMDFKEGNEFKIYEGRRIPHIKCIALDAMQDFGESILNKLWEILEERNEKFAEASRNGKEIKDIAEYRKAGYDMPRILVIIDEFQVLFDRDQNKKVADRCASRMSDFISRARVYGIHFIFATQTMHKIFEGGASISKSTLEEMHIRIGLQCQPREIELVFGAANYNECMKRRSDRKGSAIYLENDIVSKPVGMQVAYTEPEKQRKILAEIEKYFQHVPCEKMIVFRGNSEPVFNDDVIKEKRDAQDAIYLGEPISITDDVKITVSKKRRMNLLCVGENQELLDRILLLWVHQATKIHNNTKVYLMDGGAMVGEPPLVDEESGTLEIVDNIFRVLPAIKEIYEIYETRKRNMIQGIKNPEDDKQIHIIVRNYQWIEPMMKLMEKRSVSEFEMEEENEGNALDGLMSILKENENSKRSMNPSQKLYTLLESGYLCKIQFVFTCTELTLLKKLTSSELSSFTNRIVLKTASSSVYTLVDSDINMKRMRENTVLYSDGINAPYLFKPYKM